MNDWCHEAVLQGHGGVFAWAAPSWPWATVTPKEVKLWILQIYASCGSQACSSHIAASSLTASYVFLMFIFNERV